MPNNIMLVFLTTTLLLACNHEFITLQATPSEVACNGDTVKLTWTLNGNYSNGEMIISANPPVEGFPRTFSSDGSYELTIRDTTTFTASQGSIRDVITVFVPSGSPRYVGFTSGEMNSICIPNSLLKCPRPYLRRPGNTFRLSLIVQSLGVCKWNPACCRWYFTNEKSKFTLWATKTLSFSRLKI